MARRFSIIWKSVAACLVLCVGLGVGLSADQDTTTLLSKFLVDLRNGNLGVANAISKILAGDGSASAPSYSFANETNMGWYRASSGVLSASFSGTQRIQFGANLFNILADTASISLGASSDVSLSRGAANRLDLASGDSFNIVSGGLGVGVTETTAGAINALVRVTSADLIASSRYIVGSVPVISGTAPTVSSAGTSPSVSGTNTASFRVNVGTGGTATTIVMTMPAATTGWNCDAQNITANAANRANQHVVQQASTTTSVTAQNQTISTGAALAFTASDIVRFICFAY